MPSIKIIIASQACHINLYKKLNSKLSKCCASIYFNKQCLKHNLTPNYSKIKKNTYFPSRHTHTQQKLRKLRIKDEIQFLYLKKATLNKTLYQTYLKLSNERGNVWYLIVDSIHNTRKTEEISKYKILDKKLRKLKQIQNTDKITTCPLIYN